jgi:hypothetical protein
MKFYAVCFQASSTWHGKLIRKLTKCEYNHVYMEYVSEDWDSTDIVRLAGIRHSETSGVHFDLDITPEGVIAVPTRKRDGVVKKFYPLTIEEESSLTYSLSRKVHTLGNKYDWVGLFSGLFRLLIWRVMGKNVLRSVHSKGRMFCSEMVSTVLKDAFMDWDTVPSETSPCDVLNYVANSKHFWSFEHEG